jgi:hypothetical protein
MTTYEESTGAALADESVQFVEERGKSGGLGNAPCPKSALTIESIRKRADSTSEVLERILHRPLPPQLWGFNE